MLKTEREGKSMAEAKDFASPLPFCKMQALGNDFVFLLEADLERSAAGAKILKDWQKNAPALASALCDRHFGIGADGLILVRAAKRAGCQLGWSYTNADGSPSIMCGNGLRCLGLYAMVNKLVDTPRFCVETGVGPVEVTYESEDLITTVIGQPVLASDQIPVAGSARPSVVKETIEVGGRKLVVTCLSMGNPHCVIFDSGLAQKQKEELAPLLQQLPFFPDSVNVEFVEAPSRSQASVFVWERGCGPTLACASGAAAVLVAGVLEGRLDRRATIALPGGKLDVAWAEADQKVSLSGPARLTFRGNLDLSTVFSEDSQP